MGLQSQEVVQETASDSQANSVSREKSTGVVPTLIIQPSRGWRSLNLRDVWHYRELLYFLTWRDIKVRYKQTALGAAWAIIQPFFTMVVFTIFFGRLAKLPSDGYPLGQFLGRCFHGARPCFRGASPGDLWG